MTTVVKSYLDKDFVDKSKSRYIARSPGQIISDVVEVVEEGYGEGCYLFQIKLKPLQPWEYLWFSDSITADELMEECCFGLAEKFENYKGENYRSAEEVQDIVKEASKQTYLDAEKLNGRTSG